jgi:zinc/manganese transport system substrate-binding protein
MSSRHDHYVRASRRLAGVLGAAALATAMAAGAVPTMAQGGSGSVVVTTEVLGSIVGQLVGDQGEVSVIMPSGANPHSYEPSARDAERMLAADVLVSNGLDLEEALLPVLETAEAEGVTWFRAADHITVRALEQDGADDEADHEEADHDEQDHGLEDPHIWTDPLLMRDVVVALEPLLLEAGLDVSANTEALTADLEALDADVASILADVPEPDRKLVTGHRSLGYFADRYGFELIGTVIPSLSTSGEPTAREMAQLIEDIKDNGVTAVFTEEGTPQSVAQAVASDSGAELVPLSTSQLPPDGTYQDLIRAIATSVAGALAP